MNISGTDEDSDKI